jgi:hypothetical protein
LRAYSLIGYAPDRDYRYIEINRHIRQSHPKLMAEVVAGLEHAGGSVVCDPLTELLLINREFTASVLARSFETQTGLLRWHLRFDTGLAPDVTIAVRLDRSNEVPLDYYIFPSIDMNTNKIRMAEDNALSLDAYRFSSLDFFYSMAVRTAFQEAAA